MGRLSKGRPLGSGVLMSFQGRLLFTGAFSSEKPQGTGLRSGEWGPEYCTFDNGVDVTPSFESLAKIEVAIEERREIEQFFSYCPYSMTIGADEAFMAIYQSAYQALLENQQAARLYRLAEAQRKLQAEHQARINEERNWCAREFAQDRRWCLCAPFDPQSPRWQACAW